MLRTIWLSLSLVLFSVTFLTSPTQTLAAPLTIGETTILPSDDSNNGNLLLVQDVSLPQTATIQSLSFYINQASGNLRLGIYDATGAGGGPGALKAQTNSFVPVVGWNTANVITPVSLPAGNYWLAYLPSSSALHFATNFNIGSFKYTNFTFGPMPATFPAIVGQGTTHWSLYGTLNTSTSTSPDTIPPTVTITTPLNGSVATGTAKVISATATDDQGVVGVQFLIDGTNMRAEDTTSP